MKGRTAMANDSPATCTAETEWSPLAPSSTATAIGWKTTNKKRTKSANKNAESTPSDAAQSKKQCVASENYGNDSQTNPPMGPLTRQESLSTAEVLPPSTDSLPDGMTVEWSDDNTATLTFSKHPLHVCVLGRAKLKVTSGSIQVLGYHLTSTSNPIDIESPTWTSAITLVSQEPGTIVEIESIRQSHNSEQTFSLGDPSLDSIRPTMIPSSWKSAMDGVLEDLSTTDSSDKPTPTPKEQDETENDTKPEPTKQQNYARIVVCGAKHVGKSTCIRYAVNRLLSPSTSFSQVALLDCDAGQPEMSPPGLMTLTIIDKPLFSPPHHHMVMGKASIGSKQHVNACFYGHVTSKADPTLFLQCISTLLNSYVQLVKEQHNGDETKLPLLVNCDGWIKGFGYEILSATLHTIKPNHVIQLLGEVKSKQFDVTGIIENNNNTTIHEAHSYRNSNVIHEESSITVAPVAAIQSSMYRSLRLCTYFMGSYTIWDRIEFGQYGIGDHDCEIAQALAAMKPYAVPMNAVQYGTIRGVDKPCDLGSEDVTLDTPTNRTTHTSSDQSATDNECLPCVGLGLIRCIDREKRYFFILTPVPLDILQRVDVFVGGSIQVPTECVHRGVNASRFHISAATVFPLVSLVAST